MSALLLQFKPDCKKYFEITHAAAYTSSYYIALVLLCISMCIFSVSLSVTKG